MVRVEPLIFVSYLEDFDYNSIQQINFINKTMPKFIFQIGENDSNTFIDM